MKSSKTKPPQIQMVITMTRVDGLSIAAHRRAVREAVRSTGDFYGRAIMVTTLSPLIPLKVKEMK